MSAGIMTIMGKVLPWRPPKEDELFTATQWIIGDEDVYYSSSSTVALPRVGVFRSYYPALAQTRIKGSVFRLSCS